MLARLIRQIKRAAKGVVVPKIHIYDDGSDLEYKIPTDCWYTKFRDNHGRDHYWAVVNYAFQEAKRYKWDYFVMLPDDVTIERDLFRKAIDLLPVGAACLSFNTDSRTEHPNWTSVKPKPMGEVILTQWVDLCFICDNKTLTALDWSIRLVKRTGVSSGVGMQMSRRLYMLGMDMYHASEPLVHHGKHKSEMHTEHRRLNQLIH